MKKKQQTFCLAIALLAGIGNSFASDQTATVTEAINHVSYGVSATEKHAAPEGTLLHDGEFLETGKESRAELTLPSTSITRLGENAIFNYSSDTNTVDLQAGTILFCKPKLSEKTLNIRTEALTAGITGTTGFVQVEVDKNNKPTSYLFGLVEGKAKAHVNEKSFTIHGGQILEFKPGSDPVVFFFDIPRMVHTSVFFKFKHGLPNDKEIAEAIANYQDEVSRGFISPPTHAVDYSGSIPILSPSAFDSAQNAQSHGTQAPPPPPSNPNRGG
ncbi:FecR family protein [Methylacidiphilales bacterium]|nr:FecR family protein [Candidatus Methylacidiphilales bacterium]